MSARYAIPRSVLVASPGAGLALLAIWLSPPTAQHPGAMVAYIVECVQDFAVYGVVFSVLFTCVLACLLPKLRLSRRRWLRWRDVFRESIFSLGDQCA